MAFKIELPKVEVCDATEAEGIPSAGYIIINHLVKELSELVRL